ncbi:hypothetical protein [Acidisphaera sp. L21]|uniref:hypothetical protein n=1 Tax=Acidisphaera sp. L21 TaxID=1641851 RepID=UPI00131E2570|nr:hypothetical protein [Acidisphaera sp. L21]
MMSRIAVSSVMLAAALIAGCAQQSSAPAASVAAAPAAPVASAMPAGSFDGNYWNKNGAMGTGSQCNTTRFGYRLTVKNGQASMRSATAGVLSGPVSPDGTIQIQSGNNSLNGKITDNKFVGDLSMGRTGNCHFPLDYTKS